MRTLGLVLLMLLPGCGPSDYEKALEAEQLRMLRAKNEQEIKSREKCIADGGVVVQSEWHGRMKDCARPSRQTP